jgi:hypothetical protein
MTGTRATPTIGREGGTGAKHSGQQHAAQSFFLTLPYRLPPNRDNARGWAGLRQAMSPLGNYAQMTAIFQVAQPARRRARLRRSPDVAAFLLNIGPIVEYHPFSSWS